MFTAGFLGNYYSDFAVEENGSLKSVDQLANEIKHTPEVATSRALGVYFQVLGVICLVASIAAQAGRFGPGGG